MEFTKTYSATITRHMTLIRSLDSGRGLNFTAHVAFPVYRDEISKLLLNKYQELTDVTDIRIRS